MRGLKIRQVNQFLKSDGRREGVPHDAYDSVLTGWVDITPGIADEWLTWNTNNRAISKPVVDKYARDMKEGRWALNHQGFGFSAPGAGDPVLLDGQQRLKAVIQSKTTLRALVTFGLPFKSQATIDDHRKRSIVDAARVGGNQALQHFEVAIAGFMDPPRALTLTTQERILIIEAHWDAIDMVASAIPKKVKSVTISSVFAALAIAAYSVDHEDIKGFITDLCNGWAPQVDDQAKHPPILLREYLLRYVHGGHRLRVEQHIKTMRALQLYVNRKTAKKLQAPNSTTELIYKLPRNAS